MKTLNLDNETTVYHKGKRPVINFAQKKRTILTDKNDFLTTSNLDETLDFLKKNIFERLSKELSVDSTVLEFPGSKDWDKKITSTIPRKLLEIKSESIQYNSLMRRAFFRYGLHEAIIRFSQLVTDGEIDFANNKSISTRLKTEWDFYPCVLQLTHYASGKIELFVKKCYPKALFFEYDIFMC